MSDVPRPPVPGERRLDHPPSDRYRDTAEPTAEAGTKSAGSMGRALAAGLLAGLVGAGATVVLGGVLGLSAGLLVVAAATGWGIGTAIVVGGGRAMRGRVRPWLSVIVAIDAVILGQLGLWLYARTEGGVLALPDYLWQTYGLLVALQAALAIAVAWWTAR